MTEGEGEVWTMMLSGCPSGVLEDFTEDAGSLMLSSARGFC